MDIPVFRTPFNYDRDAASKESGLDTGTDTETQQQFRDEVDINAIVKRFLVTGEVPEPVAVPQYGDFSGVPDYQTALNLVIAADAAFMALDPSVRARFNNSASAFMEFMSNEANSAEWKALGLTKEVPVSKPIEVIVTNPSSPEVPKV